jgi:hypothetical protein
MGGLWLVGSFGCKVLPCWVLYQPEQIVSLRHAPIAKVSVGVRSHRITAVLMEALKNEQFS